MEGSFRAIAVLAAAMTPHNRETLLKLWAGDTSDYPSQSEADLAFCTLVSAHTDDDTITDLLMRISGLMRDKWDEARGAQTYGELTINKARQGDATSSAGKAGRKTSTSAGRSRDSQATILVNLAKKSGAHLFHDPDGDPYVTVPVGNHRETWRIHSKQLRDWLAARFYGASKTIPGSQALTDALNTLAGMARFEGEERPVHVRIGEHDGHIYLDLGDADWCVVGISADGWDILGSKDSPVQFRRPKGMLPLPAPVTGGTLSALHGLLNVRTEEDFQLIVAWLVGSLNPNGPYPVLDLSGEQGSAKSTAARLLRRLIDPSKVLLRAEPREERDLAISASNGWIIGYDNLSHIPAWLSDALCRLATGGGFGTRELYANAEETLFDFTRPAIFTAIVEAAVRGDLLDRAITVSLPAIPPEQRRTEADIEAAFTASWPGTLGVLLDAASSALRHRSSTNLNRLPRMADFAVWVEAAAPALGWGKGDFLTAYERNREKSNDLAMESLPVATVLYSFVELLPSGQWQGTATDLLHRLTLLAEPGTVRDRGWPKQAHILSGQLKRLAPNLRKVGIEIEVGIRAPGGRQRLIRIRRACVPNDDASTSTVKETQR